jgi:hypothetical protein
MTFRPGGRTRWSCRLWTVTLFPENWRRRWWSGAGTKWQDFCSFYSTRKQLFFVFLNLFQLKAYFKILMELVASEIFTFSLSALRIICTSDFRVSTFLHFYSTQKDSPEGADWWWSFQLLDSCKRRTDSCGCLSGSVCSGRTCFKYTLALCCKTFYVLNLQVFSIR